MVGSCITSCATWRHKAAAAVAVAGAAFALAACGSEADEKGRDHSIEPFPFGFEMANARAANAAYADVVDLTPAALAARIEQGDVRLIDVRTAQEVASGMIAGAEHIAMSAFDPAAISNDGQDIVLYCRSGRRSTIVAQQLAEYRGTSVPHLAGGILAWEETGRPIVGADPIPEPQGAIPR